MKRTVSLVIGIIVIVFGIVGYVSYFKDHPLKFSKPSSDGSGYYDIKGGGSGYYKDTGDSDIYGGSSGENNVIVDPIKTPNTKYNSVESVMDAYVEAFQSGDMDKLTSVIADFQQDDLKELKNREGYDIGYEFRKKYGADYKVTYEITEKKKMDPSWVEDLNNHIKSEYGSNVMAYECYVPIGTMTITGSKGSDVNEMDENSETWICRFSNGWKLVAG